MTQYPLVIRNLAPLFYRAFMLLFLCGVMLMAFIAFRDGPPEPHEWWPFIMTGFTIGGVRGLIHALGEEAAVISVRGPGSITIMRGSAFRREERWTDRAPLRIKASKDNDGDNFFELWMEAPGRPLCIAQGHGRRRLELLQQEIEAAVLGR